MDDTIPITTLSVTCVITEQLITMPSFVRFLVCFEFLSGSWFVSCFAFLFGLFHFLCWHSDSLLWNCVPVLPQFTLSVVKMDDFFYMN